MKPSDNSNSRNTDPNDVKQNQAQFEVDSGQLTGSKNATGGGSKSSGDKTQLATDKSPDILRPTDYDDIDEEYDGGINKENDDDTISSPQTYDNTSSEPRKTPGNVRFTTNSKLNDQLKVERADLEATIALRKYLTACEAVQKDMLKNGDPKKAFMKYHKAVKDIPGARPLPTCLEEKSGLRDKGKDSISVDSDNLDNSDNYEAIINSRISDLEVAVNHKQPPEENTWLKRESDDAIKALKKQGFYDREPYLPSGLRGNEIKAKAGIKASKKIRESNYISGSVPSRLYAATWRGGVHYKVDPETRSVKARYRKNTFSRGTRSQAKSFFQGMVAAGRLGDIPMNVVLNSKNPAIVRDQIKNLAEEAARRGIPLETIKIETPGLKGLKPQTLQEIVVDASRDQSQFDKKWYWRQMINPIRQSQLGRSFGQSLKGMTGVKRDSWADKLIKQDQKKRSDGTMGKKTVYTSEADVKAISNGSLYLDGIGHATMRIPEDSAEQLSANKNKDKTRLQAGKTTMDKAMDAYIEKLTEKGKFIPTDKQSDAALVCFNVVNRNENEGKGFTGEVRQLFAREVIADAKKPLAKEMRDKRTVCKKAQWAHDKTKKNLANKESEITALKNEIKTLKEDGIDTDPEEKSKLDKKNEELKNKETEHEKIEKVLDEQKKALDDSRPEFVMAYNRYHQAEYLSETPVDKWEGIVTAKPLSNENPLDEDNELTEYRRGMLNPEDTRTIEAIMDDFNEYRLTPIDQFDKNNTYKTIQAYAGKANDKVVNPNNTPVNANRETQGLGIVDTDEAIVETEEKLGQLYQDFRLVEEKIAERNNDLELLEYQAAGGESESTDKDKLVDEIKDLQAEKNNIQKSLTEALQEHITQLDAKVDSLQAENKEGNNSQIDELRDQQKDDNERLADLRGNQGEDSGPTMVPPTRSQQALTDARNKTGEHIDDAEDVVEKVKTGNNTPASENARDNATPQNY